jgi:methylthioribose-1-phosphate isomerase
MTFETLTWQGDTAGKLELTDQRLLPCKFEKLICENIDQVFDAIKTLAVRGAPAIGVAAAYGLCVAMRSLKPETLIADSITHLEKSAAYLATSRPTAVNLFWALDRMKTVAKNSTAKTTDQLRVVLLTEAHAICDEDKQMCKAIGKNGAPLIKPNATILTHCNAGALATAGQGTALSPLYEAHKNGVNFKVYADETRPLLQGSRLTAWELKQSGIDVTVICDNMAGMLMQQNKIDAIIVGADRIAANGDAANKIGTYSLSVLAKAHNIPFYIAAPSSTFDLNIETGDQIPIEQRNADEITHIAQTQIAPSNIKTYNPAFDVTPAKNITAIITEKALIENPDKTKIEKLFTS